MNDVCTVIGWEHVVSESGSEGIRLYCTKDLDPCKVDGEGCEAIRHYINPKYCQYVPTVGDRVIVTMQRGYVDKVYKIS